MTAKVSENEQKMAKHHLINEFPLEKQNYTRNQFFQKSKQLIDNLLEQNKMPIIVGGTHYYIESLLFNQEIQRYDEYSVQEIDKYNEILEQAKKKLISEGKAQEKEVLGKGLKEILQIIDPKLGEKFHSNDKRRFFTYIQIYLKTGELPSNFINRNAIGKLRFENTLIFWPIVKDINSSLQQQMNSRIDEMIEKGGLQEIYNVLQKLEDSKTGVMQAIGYKEFLPFYKEAKKKYFNQEFTFEKFKEETNSETIKPIFNECLAILKLRTYQYAKKQIKWIRSRLLSCEELKDKFYILQFEEYNIQNFKQEITEIAKKIIEGHLLNQDQKQQYFQYLAQNVIKNQNIPKFLLPSKRDVVWVTSFCNFCKKEINGEQQNNSHYNSKRHLKQVKRVQKFEQRQVQNQKDTSI